MKCRLAPDAGRCKGRSGDLGQHRLDLLAPRLEERRQLQRLARATRPARRRRSPDRRWRSRTARRRARGSRPTGNSCGPSARWCGCRGSRQASRPSRPAPHRRRRGTRCGAPSRAPCRPGRKLAGLADIDDAADLGVARLEAHRASLRAPTSAKPNTSVRIAPVGAASPSSRLTPWKPRIACSAGTSPLAPGRLVLGAGDADQRQRACRPGP